MYNVRDFGSVGDGIHDDTVAVQQAIDECAAHGGGQVLVPAGTYQCGPFALRGSINLHLEPGATIQAIVDWDRFRPFSAFGENTSEGTVWIRADDAEDVSITGGGTIDGRGVAFMKDEEHTHYNYYFDGTEDLRPQLMQLRCCRRVRLHGVTLRDSAHWGVHLIGCDDVALSDLRILNNLKVRNADGIDIDSSRNVRIANCRIESGDDSICLKSRREFAHLGPTEHVLITNCSLVSTSCAIKLGSENVAGIRNVVGANITITESNRGIAVQSRDEGFVEDVTFSNALIETRRFGDVWWGEAEPISITAAMRDQTEQKRFTGSVPPTPGPVRRIHFSNIFCRGENGVFVSGCEHSRPQEIDFSRVHVTVLRRTDFPSGRYDVRPCQGSGILELETHGFRIHHADAVRLQGCRYTSTPGMSRVRNDTIASVDADVLEA